MDKSDTDLILIYKKKKKKTISSPKKIRIHAKIIIIGKHEPSAALNFDH